MSGDAYHVYVDAKPNEDLRGNDVGHRLCVVGVGTTSCFEGVRGPDLPWLKQYKESESLEESIFIATSLLHEIKTHNFHHLFFVGVSSLYGTVARNGRGFIDPPPELQ
jgi:hypothetical protein